MTRMEGAIGSVLPRTPTEYERPAEHVMVLTDNEKDRLRSAISRFPRCDPRLLDDGRFLSELAPECEKVPDRLSNTLHAFRKHSKENGVLLFRNLPVDPALPPTPTNGGVVTKATSFSEYVLLLFMMHLGEPIGYRDEKEGLLIQNICPVKGKERRQENTGASFLKYHTEDGFHPHKPDFLGLVCLRPDHDRVAETRFASIRRALPYLSSGTIDLLRKPLFRIRFSSSFTENQQTNRFSPDMPVLCESSEEPHMCIDFHAMETDSEKAAAALISLKGALEQVATGVVLHAGDLIIIDNNVAAHARTEFRPAYDGHDRWLQRLFVVREFQASRGSRPEGSHVCYPLA